MGSIKEFVGQIVHLFTPQKLIEYISGLLEENNNLKVLNKDLNSKIDKYKKEINELLGEQGKPEFKKKEPLGNKRLPSADKDKPKKGREDNKKSSKLSRLVIDESHTQLDERIKNKKGYKTLIIQDLIFTKKVTSYNLECGYDQGGNFIVAKLPVNTFGEYGIGILSFVKTFYYQGRVPMDKIHSILKSVGIIIGKSVIVKMCHFLKNSFKKELELARVASVFKGKVIQMDDTGALVKNKTHHTFALSTDQVTILTTMESKSMMSAMYCFAGGNQLGYLLNEDFFKDLQKKRTKEVYLNYFKKYERLKPYSEEEFARIMIPFSSEKFFHRAYLIRMCAIRSWIMNTPLLNPRSILVSDDAPNYKFKGRTHQYCWVHELRHYRKLEALTEIHKHLKEQILTIFYDFYQKLKSFKQRHLTKQEIEEDFAAIMEINTGYKALDELLLRTKSRKQGLLAVLNYPFVPLHNNTCEQDLRENVIKRKVSGGTKTATGTYSWDVGLSLVHTLRKLKISFYDYLQDRYTETNNIKPLSQIIQDFA